MPRNDPLPPLLCRDPYQSSADVSLGNCLILNNNWLTKYDSVRLKVSHDQNRGEAHATPTAASTRPSKPNEAVRSIHHEERQQCDTDAGMADAAGGNAPGSDGANDASHLRPFRRRSPSSAEEGAP